MYFLNIMQFMKGKCKTKSLYGCYLLTLRVNPTMLTPIGPSPPEMWYLCKNLVSQIHTGSAVTTSPWCTSEMLVVHSKIGEVNKMLKSGLALTLNSLQPLTVAQEVWVPVSPVLRKSGIHFSFKRELMLL